MGRRQLYAAPCLIAVFLCMLLSAPRLSAVGGVPVLLTFDNLPVGSAVHTFPGLTLVNFGTNNVDGTAHFTIVEPPQGTVSRRHALQSHFDTTQELAGTHMTMAFDIAQSLITLSTGVSSATTGSGTAVLLQGFSQDPNLPGASPIVQAVTPCLGNTITPINTPLGIVDQSGSVRFAMLSLVSCASPTNPNSGGDHLTLVVDNLSYERELNPPAHEHDPPVVTIIDPANGDTVIGSAPEVITYAVRATVQEADLNNVTAVVNGNPSGPVFFSSNGPNSYNASIYLTANNGLVPGANTVTLTAKDFDRPSNAGSATVSFTFQRRPPPPPSNLDIIPLAFDVTQAIDTGPHDVGTFVNRTLGGFDIDYQQFFDVPLMAGKPTLIRVFAGVSGTNAPVNSVPALMFVRKDNCTSTCDLASGMPPISGFSTPGSPTPLLSGITVAPIGTPGSDPNVTKQDVASSWNFYLPLDWAQGAIVVDVQTNFGNYIGFPSQPRIQECSTAVDCFDNNNIRLHLNFKTPNELTVNPVFIFVEGTTALTKEAQFDALIEKLNELYPIKVKPGTRQDISVRVDISKEDLLDRIDDRSGFEPCIAFGIPAAVWLGLFPSDQGSFPVNADNTSGFANVGSEPCAVPAAWANATDFTEGAHEIGHTIGFDHWGCEHGGDQDECVVFPIPHGGTGGIGMDMSGGLATVPTNCDPSPGVPPHAHDFMVRGVKFGCKWVSWYTYNILVDHSSFASYDTPDPPMLVVRGTISPARIASIKPMYVANVGRTPSPIVEDDADDIYTIRAYDARDNTIYLQNFEPEKRDGHDAHHRRAYAFTEVIPILPTLHRIAVYKHGAFLGELRAVSPGLPAKANIVEPKPGEFWPTGSKRRIEWTLQSGADEKMTALVEYSTDGGKTRTILGRDLKVNSLTVDADQIAGSDQATIFVQVSDGLHAAEARSKPFRVANKPPSVHIMTPTTSSTVVPGMPITLSARGFDRQDQLADAQFYWSSDKDGDLGRGLSLTTTRLSLGDHTITVRVSNQYGLSSKDSIHIRVAR